jgi:tetratricopeptide (TPR) repeat protein
MRRFLLAAALSAAAGCPLAAQRLGPPVDRPRLRDVVDTNDAQAYYDLGLTLVERDARQAAAAFYWAARINPSWGEPLYARRVALLMNDRGMLNRSFEGNRRRLDTPEFRRLDSLQFRALMLSPFLYRRLDQTMFMSYIRENVARSSRMSGSGEPSRVELDYEIDLYLRRAGPELRGWLSYSRGDFTNALKQYELAADGARNKSGLRLERARIFGMLGRVDSSVAEMRTALDEMRTHEDKDVVVFYDSKAQAQYSIAVLLEGNGDTDGAREAYGQALQEDLSYYPAHLRLGLLALGKADTTTALSELALASQLATDEPYIRYTNGFVLAAAQHYDEALAELRKAVELEPYYALPYLRLGQTYEMMGKGPEAASSYQSFLDHAGRNHLMREYASGRLAEVKSILADVPKP